MHQTGLHSAAGKGLKLTTLPFGGGGKNPCFYCEGSAFTVKFETNASISPLAGQPMLMHKNTHAPKSFMNRGALRKRMGILRQHRTMGAAGFGGAFAPIVQYEKWEIHPVFPHFSYFRLCQNLSPNLLVPLCGAALRQHRTMGAAGFGGSFVPIVQYEKWEIHPVFPHFPYFRLRQNLSPNLLVPLCGAALTGNQEISRVSCGVMIQ